MAQVQTLEQSCLQFGLFFFVVADIGIPSLSIYGDTFVIINWENDNVTLFVLDLDGWCEKIKSLKSSFLSLEFQHVYREHNQIADFLSKEALILAIGKLSHSEFFDGYMIGGGETHIL